MGPARSLLGAGNRPALGRHCRCPEGLSRTKRGDGEGRGNGEFFGFRFPEPNSFQKFFSGGMGVEEGGSSSRGVFTARVLGSARVQATARVAGSVGGCVPGCGDPAGPQPSLLSLGGGGGRPFRWERVQRRRPSYLRRVRARPRPRPGLQAPLRLRAPETWVEGSKATQVLVPNRRSKRERGLKAKVENKANELGFSEREPCLQPRAEGTGGSRDHALTSWGGIPGFSSFPNVLSAILQPERGPLPAATFV
jgi:hypothetical protein